MIARATIVAMMLVLWTTSVWAQDKSDTEYFQAFKTRLDTIGKHVSVVQGLDVDMSSMSLKAALQKLGRKPDPKDVFFYVRDNIGYEPYEGHLRGTRSIMMTRAGNSLDQSLLLRELLVGFRYKARIAYGDLNASDRERLLTAYVGKATLAGSNIPSGGSRYDPTRDRGLQNAVKRHYWVEAKVGKSWKAMSPAFPRGVYGVPPTRKDGEHDAIPPEAKVMLTVKVHAALEGGKQTELMALSKPLGELAYRNLVLTFEPTGSGRDWQPKLAIAGQNVTGSRFEWAAKSRIWVEFFFDRGGKVQNKVVRDLYLKGGALNLFDSDLQVFSLLVMPGWMNEAFLSAVAKRELAALHKDSVAVPATLKNELNRTIAQADAAGLMRGYLVNMLSRAGGVMALTYANVSDRATLGMARLFGVRAYFDEPRVVIVGGVRRGDRLYWQIDLRRDTVRAVPAVGLPPEMAHAFQAMRGRFASQFEAAVVRSLTGKPLISVGMILSEAGRKSIPIKTLLPGNINALAGNLNMSNEATRHLKDFARTTGDVVVIPATPLKVEGKPVACWWGVDPLSAELTAVREDGAYGSFSKDEIVGLTRTYRKGNLRILVFDEVLALLENLTRTVASLLQSEPNVCPVLCDAQSDLKNLPSLMCQDKKRSKFEPGAEAKRCLGPSKSGDGILGLAVSCEEQTRAFRCGSAMALTTIEEEYTIAFSEPPFGHATGPWDAAALKSGDARACTCR